MGLLSIIRSKIDERLAVGDDDSFYIFNLADVQFKYQKWIEKIPRVIPFYAVKCNDNPEIVKTLAELGAGFDCASKMELQQILELGVHQDRIIYAHTMKQMSHLKFAADNGVQMLTFDCSAELRKIKQIQPTAKVVLRIRFDAENSIIKLGLKFGCDPISEAPQLIELCKDMKMNLIGISFHVGSGVLSGAEIYEGALQAVRQCFDIAADFGFELKFVDIGGGFMGDDITLLDNYAECINRGVDKYFPDPSVTIISEPGRYFAQSAYTLVVQVVLKKVCEDGHIFYYINESMYQSFIMNYIYKTALHFDIIRMSEPACQPIDRLSTIWGQTCSSADKIIHNEMIPELEIGDFIVFRNMGAYTTVVSSSFNGFKIGEIISQ